ncbi:MAG: bifunctional demethylmenaquinone methyltransferase/2-methoxy-6-polyprenyl-1,4-benzoquinol methylase [Bacteroidetes bacterium GWF2_33_16]|nr:MAG: bifunctional demethylmenaquinone methyltransferase/2-methoxy-6-polyprenyl-1,4-benzoquinol methylase [Bacteroidetes bacterium GWE2_32_14]OFY06605.1 MAG: bifunctional demethylmenaquinone methyltransferase/2-methoxy-6-polyprenyl-1,4-benzoquinol methylase [Bacteroidetes bacterium GWF2_33_16]
MSVTKPYSNQQTGKKEQVAAMFNNIARRYDFLNHFLSLGIDIIWRRKAINRLKDIHPKQILDVATGTADLAIEALRLNPERILGIDISDQMLELGKQKIRKKNCNHIIDLQKGDSENIQFSDHSFDAVTVAFGVRNFENLEKGLSEIFRVLKPKGRLIVLEFSKPNRFPVKQFYHFYFKVVLPLIGRIVSKDKSAYTYLPESVMRFPEKVNFINLLEQIGFKKCSFQSLSFGIACIYIGNKE